MAKPNTLAKSGRHVHLKFTVGKKTTKLNHKEGACGCEEISEIQESDERFIVKVTKKFPFEKDKVVELTFPKDKFKWEKSVW